MKLFDLKEELGEDDAKYFSEKLEKSNSGYVLYGLLDRSNKLRLYPPNIINKWFVNTPKNDYFIVLFRCLKKCDEYLFYEFYGYEYIPLTIDIMKENKKDDNINHFIVRFHLESIDDFDIKFYKEFDTLEEAIVSSNELITFSDSLEILNFEQLQDFFKLKKYTLDDI